MIFNQFGFLFVFLPVVFTLFCIPGLRPFRPYLLIAASLTFYGLSGVHHALVLIADIIWVYWLTRSDRYIGNRTLLVLAILPPFLGLFYFKYLGFVLSDVLMVANSHDSETFELFSNIILPAGISFFTFQVVSFAIDRYRGEVPETVAFKKFAVYISFFPQLVAGPILRYREAKPALDALTRFRPTADDLAAALGYIGIGLALKVLLADTLGMHLENYKTAPGSAGLVAGVYVVLAYSFQIYFDFYGYSLIAIGLGRLFGFKFPDNFRQPYLAANPREFWRRWHITLSNWIRDYLYISLGGNKAYARNILLVFLIMGLWHGAGWSFIVWGAFHGLFVITYHYTRDWWDRMAPAVQIALNFFLVSLAWLFFLFDFAELSQFLSGVGDGGRLLANLPNADQMLILAVAALEQIRFNRGHILLRQSS